MKDSLLHFCKQKNLLKTGLLFLLITFALPTSANTHVRAKITPQTHLIINALLRMRNHVAQHPKAYVWLTAAGLCVYIFHEPIKHYCSVCKKITMGILLWYAVARNNLALTQSLLSSGVHPDFVADPLRRTPLMAAVNRNELEIARALLDAGAYVNQETVTGNTPIHFLPQDNLELLNLLLEKGSHAFDPDNLGRTSLMIYAHLGYTNVVQRLASVANIDNINQIDGEGRTALFYAVCHDNRELASLENYQLIMKALLDAGALTTVVTNSGLTVEDATEEVPLLQTVLSNHLNTRIAHHFYWEFIDSLADQSFKELMQEAQNQRKPFTLAVTPAQGNTYYFFSAHTLAADIAQKLKENDERLDKLKILIFQYKPSLVTVSSQEGSVALSSLDAALVPATRSTEFPFAYEKMIYSRNGLQNFVKKYQSTQNPDRCVVL